MKSGSHGLPLRSAVVARRRRRLRRLAAIAALACAGFVAAVAHEVWPRRAEVIADVASVLHSPAAAGVEPVAAPFSTRPVYRHSIVPGGAYSRGDVADAMRKDAVVAAHYQHVNVDKVHTTTVAAPRAVFVSYRVGNQVYWTKNRVRLSPGETVLTDGHTEIRARCGNLLSDHAQQPVADQEPAVTLLDQAETETGSSTIAGARSDDGRSPHVPFFAEWSDASSVAFEKTDPIPGAQALDLPMWFGGGGVGGSPFLGSSTGTTGTSLVAPLGSSARGLIGGGSEGANDHNGDGTGNNGKNDGPNGGSTGGGSSDGGSAGGGSAGGGSDENSVPPIQPPFTTTGGGTTTGNVVIETSGGVTTGDTTGGGDGDDEVPSVPEPSTLVLLGVGASGAAARAIRRRRSVIANR